MKVCLIANNSLRVSPYVKKYASLLDELNIEYDIISKEPAKDGTVLSENIYYYKQVKTPLGKLNRFIGYANFIKKKLKSYTYDKVVFFTGANAAFAYLKLGKYMRNNFEYILDIRDYDKSFKNIFISPYLKKAVKHAAAVFVSSARFKKWIPETKNIYVMHNLPNNCEKKEFSTVFSNEKIRIGYFGGIGYFEQNRFLVDSLKNHEKFIFTYRGIYPTSYNIKDYCTEQNITNVEFFGRYSDNEKDALYNNIDIINAVYGNNSLIVTTALPNKLYDCAYYKIPIMVNDGTYLAEVVEKYSLGFSVSTDTNQLSQKLGEYINNFNKEAFEKGCEKFLEYAESEQKETDTIIKNFFEKEEKI